MSAAEQNGGERDDGDMIAAEYVLGVLPAAERAEAARRVEVEPGFAALVDRWEMALSPLAMAYPSVEPPASVKQAVDRRLFSSPPATVATGGFWTNVAVWRGIAAAALAALLLVVAMPYLNPPPQETPQARLVASLAADGSDVRYLVVYDAGRGDVALSHVSGERSAGHDFELWMIDGSNSPVSMGVIPIGAATHLELAPAARQKLASGAVLAVSLEPSGGSPTGQPTGPVVAAGDLKSI